MKCVVASLALVGSLWITGISKADDELLHAPGTQPVATATSQPARPDLAVSPAAQRVLAEITSAYNKMNVLELAGTVHLDYDMDGKPEQNADSFKGYFQSPNKFVNEVPKNMIAGSTGDKVYAFSVEDNDYVQKDAPKERTGPWPSAILDVIKTQNPSLAMLLSSDPATQLIDTAAVFSPASPDAAGQPKSKQTIELLSPTKYRTVDCLTLQLTNDDGVFTFLIDPQSYLLRQFTADQRKYFQKLGHQQVNKAMLVFDYTSIATAPKVDDKLLAWTPPANARELAAPVPAVGGAEGASAALVGKPAPDFKLVGLDGKPVTLSEQRGSVVVVDFWATWCGPCVASLPHLNKVYEDHKKAGLKVFAVSVDDDQSKVKPFAEENHLTIHVLLDDDKHATSRDEYKAEGIPQTVVIGKDGIVKQVFVGFGPGSEEALTKTVEEALK
jgi:peroxiredoxin